MKIKQLSKISVRLKKQLHRHIRMAFVPHRANQYRPHATRRYGLVALLLLVVGLQVGYNMGTTGTVLGQEENISSDELLSDTNDRRTQQRLPPLRSSAQLNKAAFLKAQDMMQKQYWAHVSPEGTQPWKWLGDVGYNYSHAGENLAKNYRSAAAVTEAWMNSPEHKANVLGPDYQEVGFAVVDGTLEGKPVSLVVAMYGSEVSSATVAGVRTEAAPPLSRPVGLLAGLGMVVLSLTPAAIGSVLLLLIAIITALTAHAYRHKLPKALRKSWYLHHGAYKAAGLASLVVVVISLYGGGQI